VVQGCTFFVLNQGAFLSLIKCNQSFLIGAFASFAIMMLVTAFVITEEFVSKTSLLTRIVYIDGKTYDIKERR
jgi:hypothetical protein